MFRLLFLVLLFCNKQQSIECAKITSIPSTIPSETHTSTTANIVTATTMLPMAPLKIGEDQYKLTTQQQCLEFVKVFVNYLNNLNSVTFVDSCQANFIQINRLYDNSLLVFVSMRDWDYVNRSLIVISEMKTRVCPIFSRAQLVVRVDGCLPRRNQVPLRISPLIRSSPSIMVTISDRQRGVGEQFVKLRIGNEFINDMYEVTFLESNRMQCSLANLYLVMCARDRDRICEVQQDGQQFSCDCEDYQYLFILLCLALLILLTIFSLAKLNKKSPEEASDKEEYVNGLISDRDLAYYYKVIYRVACPTSNFDFQNTVIELNVLDDKLEQICASAAFSLKNMAGNKWNIFVTNMFVPKPLPKLKAVCVSHQHGVPGSGIFLFDVQIKFMGGPDVDAMIEIDQDDDIERKQYTLKPKEVNESSIKSQKLPIYKYILDRPKVYTKLRKGDKWEQPPMPYPEVNSAFLKLLVWLFCWQSIWMAIILLDYVYLKFEMIMVSICIALLIWLALVIEFAIIIWIHLELNRASLNFDLLVDFLVSSAKSRKSKKTKGSQCNWARHANSCLTILLLLAICGSMGVVGLMWKQPYLKALYILAIFFNVIVLVVGVGLLTHNSIHRWPMFTRDRIAIEERLMAESNLRGGLLSTTLTSTNSTKLPNTNNTSPSGSASPSRQVTVVNRLKLAQGTLPMFNESINK